MVLPVTSSAVLTLIILSIACFALWPNIFRLGGKWRFELFSFDFAAGALLLAVVAAYTLGTLGSALDFSDSLLVAGRRAELMAVLAGAIFAFGNMLYLATISLRGISNGTLVVFGVFGCAISLLELVDGSLVTAGTAFFLFTVATVSAIITANAKRSANQRQAKKLGHPGSLKGAITGVLAGATFAFVLPVLKMAESEQLAVGAYGGLLLATVGVLVSTFFFSFFFLNLSLEGGNLNYSSYLSGTMRNHLAGGCCGLVWAAGALALYVACTSTVGVTLFRGWIAPFFGALLAVISGLVFWPKLAAPTETRRNTIISTVVFAAGVVLLLSGLR